MKQGITKTNDTFYDQMLLWSVFAGSRSPKNRVKIINELRKTPLNANQLANKLNLDYKVVERHLAVLNKNNILTRTGSNYGVVYFLSSFMESNIETFDGIVKRLKIKK